jgi:hypothetical protein
MSEPAASTSGSLRDRLSRPERLLPWACLAAAAVLFASQLMTMFEFTPPGAEPLQSRSVIDDHGQALLVVAAFAALAVVVAVWAPSKPAAMAVALMGGIALLFFLLTDLPDAGRVGTLDDVRQSFFDAEAVPQAGFWLELVGALGLAVSGAALATLSPEQLGSLRPGAGRPPAEPPAPDIQPTPAPVASANPGHGTAEAGNGPAGERARARRR